MDCFVRQLLKSYHQNLGSNGGNISAFEAQTTIERLSITFAASRLGFDWEVAEEVRASPWLEELSLDPNQGR
jgi:hypothetical protein